MQHAQPSVTAMSPSRFASIGRSARGVREVLGVAGLVEERLPVVVAADRLDHEHHLAGDLDRRAERARALPRALLEVEVDVLLRARSMPRSRSVASSAGSIGRAGRLRRAPARGRARRRPQGRASARPIPSRARKSRSPARSQRLSVSSRSSRALGGELVEPEAEALVELVVVRRARARRRPRGRSAPPRGRPGSARSSSRRSRARSSRSRRSRSGSFDDRDAQHPVRDLLAVDRRLELGLDLGELLLVLAGQVAEVALAGEAPELGRARPQPLRRLEPRQLLVPLVDRLELERLLVARRSGGSTPRRARR